MIFITILEMILELFLWFAMLNVDQMILIYDD